MSLRDAFGRPWVEQRRSRVSEASGEKQCSALPRTTKVEAPHANFRKEARERTTRGNLFIYALQREFGALAVTSAPASPAVLTQPKEGEQCLSHTVLNFNICSIILNSFVPRPE